MRLDHLLSKEKIIVSLFCRLGGCLVRYLVGGEFFVIARCRLASGGGGFYFQVKASPTRGFMRVWGDQ